jgi:hypothetical protein
VVVLVLAALLLIFVIASLSLDEGDEEPVEITGADEVQRQLGGIPQDGAVLGSSEASVTVQVFSDLQCVPCADYQRETITPLIEGPVRDGDLKLEFHHFQMAQSGFANASFGAVAAAEQDDEWQFIQLFINQTRFCTGRLMSSSTRSPTRDLNPTSSSGARPRRPRGHGDA